MGKLKFTTFLVITVVFFIGCSKEPTKEANEAKAAIDAAIAESAVDYASEDVKKLNEALNAALTEIKAQQNKTIKSFGEVKDVLVKVKAHAENSQFNNEVQHLGEQKRRCYSKCLWKNNTNILL